jgi:hypothetical protein
MVHAKDAKDAKGGMGISKFGFRNSKIIFCRDVERILLNYLSAPQRPWREINADAGRWCPRSKRFRG